MAVQEACQLVNLLFYIFFLVRFQIHTVVQMDISRLFVRRKQLFLYCFSVYLIRRDIVQPLLLKAPLILQHPFLNQVRFALQHHDKAVFFLFQVFNILFAEISPVQNETDLFVFVSYRFVHHAL